MSINRWSETQIEQGSIYHRSLSCSFQIELEVDCRWGFSWREGHIWGPTLRGGLWNLGFQHTKEASSLTLPCSQQLGQGPSFCLTWVSTLAGSLFIINDTFSITSCRTVRKVKGHLEKTFYICYPDMLPLNNFQCSPCQQSKSPWQPRSMLECHDPSFCSGSLKSPNDQGDNENDATVC